MPSLAAGSDAISKVDALTETFKVPWKRATPGEGGGKGGARGQGGGDKG